MNIAPSMLGNFCHGDEDKELHMENMGNNACVVVGFNNMGRIQQHLFFSTIQQYRYQTTNQHKGLDGDSDDNKVYMIRLNPHSVDKK